MKSAVPRTTSSMPSVTRKEGIFSRVTNSPLTSPMSAAPISASANATSSEVTPALNSVHISTGEKPKSEPTERSNSPEVISSVMASAISPSSTVKTSVLEMFCGERKSGLIAVKTASSTTSRMNGPNSGLAIRRWISARSSTSEPSRCSPVRRERDRERDGRSTDSASPSTRGRGHRQPSDRRGAQSVAAYFALPDRMSS